VWIAGAGFVHVEKNLCGPGMGLILFEFLKPNVEGGNTIRREGAMALNET